MPSKAPCIDVHVHGRLDGPINHVCAANLVPKRGSNSGIDAEEEGLVILEDRKRWRSESVLSEVVDQVHGADDMGLVIAGLESNMVDM